MRPGRHDCDGRCCHRRHFLTAGAAAQAMYGAVQLAALSVPQAMVVGAIAGAAGSVASQVVGVAIGAQEKFSWSGVALAAIGGAISGGIANGLNSATSTGPLAGEGWKAAAGRAILASTASQAVGLATGLQEKFSWRSVAAAGAGAAMSSALGEPLGLAQKGVPHETMQWGERLLRGTVSGFAAGATAAIVKGGKISISQVAADAFGNALGNSLIGHGRKDSQHEIDSIISEAELAHNRENGDAQHGQFVKNLQTQVEVNYLPPPPTPVVELDNVVIASAADNTGAYGDVGQSLEQEAYEDAAPYKHKIERNPPHMPVRNVLGVETQPPTQAELAAEIARRGPHKFTDDMFETRAFNENRISVTRDEVNKVVTLHARGTIFGPLNWVAVADAMDHWDELSHKDPDGYTYKSDVKFTRTNKEQGADVILNYKSIRELSAYAHPNGSVFLDNQYLNGAPAGLLAHEITHAFFGVRDGYIKSVVMPSGYVVGLRPHAGFEKSLMGDYENGNVRGNELKELTLKYESLIKDRAAIRKK